MTNSLSANYAYLQMLYCIVKVKANIAQSYGTSLAIWDHSVICHPTQVNVPRLTPAMQAGT